MVDSNRFTREGFEIHKRRIADQEAKVRSMGGQVGEAAGDNCDWHDNAPFDEAKRALEMESRRLQELRDAVRNLAMVEIQEQNGRVQIGSTVVVYFTEEDREAEYTIGAFGESAPKDGLVSYTSPLARALIGMQSGDSRNVRLGRKDVEIEIVRIEPPSYRYKALMAKIMAGEIEAAASDQ